MQCRIVDYLEAEKLCGGKLPDYIPRASFYFLAFYFLVIFRFCLNSTSYLSSSFQDSKPRIVEVGGVWCPCGGTHVKDIKEIGDMKVQTVPEKSVILFKVKNVFLFTIRFPK